MANQVKSKKARQMQLLLPLLALLLLVLFNLIFNIEFFGLRMRVNNAGNTVLTGNLISILNEGSELAILALGMTLVTASSKGQDISVGAIGAIAGSVLMRVLLSAGTVTIGTILLGLLLSILVAMAVGAFNGGIVAIFKIQPMIATLIIFNMGRSIAYWINGGATPTVESKLFGYLGGFIPGIPIPTPVFVMALVAFIFWLILKFTSLRLYTQAVGINQEAARLNGINIVWTKMFTFIILGACCAIAGAIGVARLTLINHETLLIGREMDAILAVAIGGNALSGGKFNMAGSLLGAYVIQFLMTTLYAMGVPSTDVNAYKAVVIVLIVLAGSPVVKRAVGNLYHKLFRQQNTPAVKEVS